MNVSKLIGKLKDKGIKLLPASEQKELSTLKNINNRSVDDFIIEFYSQCNGFYQPDNRSQVFLWPIQRILENLHLSITIDGIYYAAFGDWMLDSDFIMWPIVKKEARVFLLFERREMALSIPNFINEIATGKYDFLPNKV